MTPARPAVFVAGRSAPLRSALPVPAGDRSDAGQGTHGNGLLERRLQALAEERRRLAMIIDGTAAGTWEWNVQTGEMRVNARWPRLSVIAWMSWNRSARRRFLKLVHPDDIALSDAALDDHFEGAATTTPACCACATGTASGSGSRTVPGL